MNKFNVLLLITVIVLALLCVFGYTAVLATFIESPSIRVSAGFVGGCVIGLFAFATYSMLRKY